MFKIKSRRINKKEFLIEIWEGDIIVQTKMAINISERDKIIYELSDLHNIVDVEHINIIPKMSESNIKNSIAIPVIPYTDMFQLENYFNSDGDYIFNRILEAIAEGLVLKKKKIKLFQINNSGVYVDSLKRDWPAGLRIAHEYFFQEEQYDKCQECVRLLTALKSIL